LPVTDLASTGFDADLELIREAARVAGELAMRYFRRDPQVWMKAGNSPVTEGDLAVDKLLHDRLSAARPDYGWLSEETADSLERLSAARTFVVDPIDGTRGFIAGSDEWCVSVAVVRGTRSIAGVLVAPATGEVFTAREGGPAEKNGAPIGVQAPGERLTIAAPERIVGRLPEEFRRTITKVGRIPSLA
jgi:myo-inositol-1(or 4)-monophosphatase